MTDSNQKTPNFLLVEEEAADVIIRICDLSGLKGWRVGEEILAKTEYNKSRPRKHNKCF